MQGFEAFPGMLRRVDSTVTANSDPSWCKRQTHWLPIVLHAPALQLKSHVNPRHVSLCWYRI